MTSFLPISVYFLTRRLYPCVLTSQLAAIFTACSLPLSVLGTHALDISLLSPFVVASVTPLVGFFLDTRYNPTAAMLKSYVQNGKDSGTKSDRSRFHTHNNIGQGLMPVNNFLLHSIANP